MDGLAFSVDGKWMTDFIKEQFFYEHKDYKWLVDTVEKISAPNGFSKERIERIAQDLVLDRSWFTGNTGDGSFCLCESDKEEPVPTELFDKFDFTKNALQEKEKRCAELLSAWQELALVATGEIKKDDCECKENIELFEPTPLEQFVDRMIEAPNVLEYGFLSPDGTFYPVKWCNHQEFASEWVEEHGLVKARYRSGRTTDLDYLVLDLGWVLLHNPNGYGKPIMTNGPLMSKQQREYLYDYFTKAHMEEEANALFVDAEGCPMAYRFHEGYSDADEIKFCPKCGAEIGTWFIDGTASCWECGLRFAVIQICEKTEDTHADD